MEQIEIKGINYKTQRETKIMYTALYVTDVYMNIINDTSTHTKSKHNTGNAYQMPPR